MIAARLRSPYAAVFGGALVAVAVLAITVAAMSVSDRASLAFEAAKASIAVLTGTFLGFIVAEFVRQRDQRRSAEQRTAEARRAFRADILQAYNEARSVRRVLRAGGLRPDGAWTLTAEQLALLDAQLMILSDAQLTADRLAREDSADAVGLNRADEIGLQMVAAEKALNLVVKEWERERSRLNAGSNDGKAEAWPELDSFLTDESTGNFDTVVKAIHQIERLIALDLDPAAPA